MAAHVVTALTQEKEKAILAILGFGYDWGVLPYALDNAPWANLLDTDHWKAFHDVCDKKSLQELEILINELLPHYKAYAEYCGDPKTYEEWMEAIEEKHAADAYEFTKTRDRLLLMELREDDPV